MNIQCINARVWLRCVSFYICDGESQQLVTSISGINLLIFKTKFYRIVVETEKCYSFFCLEIYADNMFQNS